MSSPLSKDDVRQARLRAIECGSSTTNEPAEKRPTLNSRHCLDLNSFNGLKNIMVGDNVTAEDMDRWYSQGFNFCEEPIWGLKQGHGGPCGILASIQAEILRELCFSGSSVMTTIPTCNTTQIIHIFSTVIVKVLKRASGGPSKITIVLPAESISKPISDLSSPNDFFLYEISDVDEAKRMIIDHMASFQSGCGVVIFLMSLILTRGVQTIRNDMDDEKNSMIGQFGHSSQDLINLLLSGRAASNVFDGIVPMGDGGLMLKGIMQPNDVGYLTQLEALRYCQVGSYYKVPSVPIWVLGSSSHFTTLFSLERAVNDESAEEKLLSRAQRAFKAADPDECGFITVEKLKEVLSELNISFVDDEIALARLRGHLQLDGGIIIWSTFWESISRLMTGTVLDDLFTVPKKTETEAVGTRERSDSDFARELQAEFDAPANNTTATAEKVPLSASLDFSNILGQFNSVTTLDEPADTRIRSDSDIAR